MLISKEKCDELTDEEMVAMALKNVDFFSCIYERYGALLLKYIHRISGVSDGQAEDILQESFIKVWKNLNAYNPGLKLSSWLYRIVHNQAVSQWRKDKTKATELTLNAKDIVSAIYAEDHIDAQHTEASINLIEDTLQKLPDKYKQVLVLKYYEKMSYEDISDVLKIPEGTVATRINRAKSALRKLT
jgi:RNA polymerase sigma-70 factor (ECF subfamily)